MATLCFDKLTEDQRNVLTEALFAFANASQAFFATRAELGPGGLRQTVTFDTPDMAGRFTAFLDGRFEGAPG